MKTEASARLARTPRPQDVGVGPRLGKALWLVVTDLLFQDVPLEDVQ